MNSIIPHEIDQSGLLSLRTCIICQRSLLVMQNSFGFVEQPSGRSLFAVYGLDGTGHSTLRGVLDSNGSNFTCLKCHSKKWSFDL
jgi:hypothetical protein